MLIRSSFTFLSFLLFFFFFRFCGGALEIETLASDPRTRARFIEVIIDYSRRSSV